MNSSLLKVLITGAGGQLGQEFIHSTLRHENLSIIALTKAELDITSLIDCKTQLHHYRPNIVIHCAAYTAVDKAETDKEQAFLINEEGTKNIAISSAEVGAKLVYISTDYVFDGLAIEPYPIDASTNPQTVYGLSKLAGERMVQLHHEQYFIVRTSWVFGSFGQNFVKTMLKMGEAKQTLKVVADQIGSPTYTVDLVQFLLELMVTDKYGIYHATNSGQCTWYEFATKTFKIANLNVEVTPCSSDEFPRPAKRPSYSVLSPNSIISQGFKLLPPWQDSLKHMLDILAENEKR